MKLQFNSLADVERVVEDIKKQKFLPEDGFIRKHLKLSYATYKVVGKNYYIRSAAFSKKIAVVTFKNISNLEKGFNLMDQEDHKRFFEREELIENVEAFDVESDRSIIDLLEKVELIETGNSIVKKYLEREKPG